MLVIVLADRSSQQDSGAAQSSWSVVIERHQITNSSDHFLCLTANLAENVFCEFRQRTSHCICIGLCHSVFDITCTHGLDSFGLLLAVSHPSDDK